VANQQHEDRYRWLVQAITKSLSASEFCRNLVHSVFKGHSATSALICRLAIDSHFAEVGSYGLDHDELREQMTNVFDTNLLSTAVRNQQATFALDRKSLAVPLIDAGILSGGLLVTFSEPVGQDEISEVLVECLGITSGQFVANGKATAATQHGTSPSLQHVPTELSKRQVQILSHLDQEFTYAQVGRALHVSESLVKQEAGRVFRYLGVNTRREAVSVALAMGVLPMLSNTPAVDLAG